MTKLCVICGKPFAANHYRKTCCTQSCLKINRSIYNLHYLRGRYRSRKSIKQCRFCGDKFLAFTYKSYFCKKESCRRNASKIWMSRFKLKVKLDRYLSMKRRPCVRCGSLLPVTAYPNVKTCSSNCKSEHVRSLKRNWMKAHPNYLGSVIGNLRHRKPSLSVVRFFQSVSAVNAVKQTYEKIHNR